jgi:hypothetical protein
MQKRLRKYAKNDNIRKHFWNAETSRLAPRALNTSFAR